MFTINLREQNADEIKNKFNNLRPSYINELKIIGLTNSTVGIIFQINNHEKFCNFTKYSFDRTELLKLDVTYIQDLISYLPKNHPIRVLDTQKDYTLASKIHFNYLYGEFGAAGFQHKSLFEPLEDLFFNLHLTQAQFNKNFSNLLNAAIKLDSALKPQDNAASIDAINKFYKKCYETLKGYPVWRGCKALAKAAAAILAAASVLVIAAIIGAILFSTTSIGFMMITLAALIAVNPAAIVITAIVGTTSVAAFSLTTYGLFKKSLEERTVDEIVDNAKQVAGIEEFSIWTKLSNCIPCSSSTSSSMEPLI